MRHQVGGRKLGRKTEHRKSLFRNQVTSLIEHGRIKTTLPKAKELRSFAEKMITLAKKDTLASRRQALAFVKSKEAVKKLFSELGPRFKDRQGGYTRIYKLGFRPGDGADMALIEYLPDPNATKQEDSAS